MPPLQAKAMKSPTIRAIAAIGLAFAGAALIWLTEGKDIFGRTVKLLEHLDTTGWPAAESTDPIERALRKQYGSSEWLPQIVTPTSPALPLDPSSIDETFRRIGHALPTPGDHFDIRSLDLPSAYAAFLSDQIAALAPDSEAARANDDRDLWQRFVQAFTGRDFKIAPADLEKVRRAVQRLPDPHPLRTHVQEFLLLSEQFGRYAPALDVGASPAYSDPDRWEAKTFTEDGTLGRCRGYVAPLSEEAKRFPAEISVFPRVASLEIRRPWMREHLLDAGLAAAPKGNAGRYFGEAGSLRQIPTRVWVQVEDEIRFSVDEELRPSIANLIAQNDCCVAICKTDRTIIKSPAVFQAIGETRSTSQVPGGFVGLQNGQQPIVYAVISRRRIAGIR